MSQNINVPCNTVLTSHSIGIYNYIQVLSIPVGVTVRVAFKHTPRDDERYPLTERIKDLDTDGDFREPRECFLTTTGTSTSDIKLIVSQIIGDSGYVEVERLNTLALEASTKSAIETLSKEISPYQDPIHYGGIIINTSIVTMLSKTLVSDKINVSLFKGMGETYTAVYNSVVSAYLDGNLIAVTRSRTDNTYDSFNDVNQNIIEGCKGKLLEIKAVNDSANPVGYFLQEFTKKV
jgi:hypothetical protein